MAETARMHLLVEGRVQGVGFRYFVVDLADQLSVLGWVRNRWDGTVEVLAEGERTSLEKLLSEIRRGPRAAFVSQVKESWDVPTGEFKDFRVVSSV
jgi:acylphosphatase